MHIVNPFSNIRVPLLPMSAIAMKDMDIEIHFEMFAALSSSNPHNTIVMIAAWEFGILAFARPGDDSWTSVVDEHFPYDDVIFYKGAFYAVSEYGTFVCDIENPHPKTKLIAPNLSEMVVHKRYLVESAGELLLVHRYNDWENDGTIEAFHYTLTFDVYKMDMSMHKWNQVKSLDDRALFLGFNTSFSVSSLNYEDCNCNCIYYQDAYQLGLMVGHGTCIFYLKDRSIKPLNEDNRLIQPIPILVTPLPW